MTARSKYLRLRREIITLWSLEQAQSGDSHMPKCKSCLMLNADDAPGKYSGPPTPQVANCLRLMELALLIPCTITIGFRIPEFPMETEHETRESLILL